MSSIVDTQAGIGQFLAGGETTPLQELARRALRRYGETSPDSFGAESMMLFVDYANEVVDDILGHPYTPPGLRLDYYVNLAERRQVPDHIMLAGLMARHAAQQKSEMAPAFWGSYYSTLNRIMLRARFGAAPEFEMSPPDMPAPAGRRLDG